MVLPIVTNRLLHLATWILCVGNQRSVLLQLECLQEAFDVFCRLYVETIPTREESLLTQSERKKKKQFPRLSVAQYLRSKNAVSKEEEERRSEALTAISKRGGFPMSTSFQEIDAVDDESLLCLWPPPLSIANAAAIIDALNARTVVHNVFTFILMTLVLLYFSPLLKVGRSVAQGIQALVEVDVAGLL